MALTIIFLISAALVIFGAIGTLLTMDSGPDWLTGVAMAAYKVAMFPASVTLLLLVLRGMGLEIHIGVTT